MFLIEWKARIKWTFIKIINLEINLFGMIVTKVLNAEKKEVIVKPERVKIKHKTYRELLGLDRPKRQIKLQSDSDNDDFLEKLLREEQKQKKKKKKNNKPKQKKSGFSKERKRNEEGSILPDPTKPNQAQQALTTTKRNQQIEKTVSDQNQNSKLKVLNKSLQNQKQVKDKNINEKTIKIDESNEVPIVIANRFTKKVGGIRSSQSLNRLQKQNQKIMFTTTAKLNPQLHTITHTVKQEQIFPKFKPLQMTVQKLLSMTSTWKVGPMQKRVHRRQKLFKDPQEEDMFLKSVRQTKVKKYSMPSLL